MLNRIKQNSLNALSIATEIVLDVGSALETHPKFVVSATIGGAIYGFYYGVSASIESNEINYGHLASSNELKQLQLEAIDNHLIDHPECWITSVERHENVRERLDPTFGCKSSVDLVDLQTAVHETLKSLVKANTVPAGPVFAYIFGTAGTTIAGTLFGFFSSVALVNAKEKLMSTRQHAGPSTMSHQHNH